MHDFRERMSVGAYASFPFESDDCTTSRSVSLLLHERMSSQAQATYCGSHFIQGV